MERRTETDFPSSPASLPSHQFKRKGTSEYSNSHKKRAQVPKACDRCKRLRKGCSGYRPCQRCCQVGLGDQCLLAESSDSPRRKGPRLDGPRPDLEEVDSLPPPASVIEYCCQRFFSDLGPTVPIITPEYAVRLRAAVQDPWPSITVAEKAEARCLLSVLCAVVLLQVDSPENRSLEAFMNGHTNASYGNLLFEGALVEHRHLLHPPNPSLEQILTTFFLYACHATLFHHSQAFFYLREATTLFLLLKPECFHDQSVSKIIADRLFWVLLVSERAHAIRYRRSITLQITSTTPAPTSDFFSPGLRSLIGLFKPLGTSFFALLNQELGPEPPIVASAVPSPLISNPNPLTSIPHPSNTACRHHHQLLSQIETSLTHALTPSSAPLHTTQKSNLRVTQLWLRIILWQLRLRLGHLVVESFAASAPTPRSLTYRYPLDVARDVTLSTCDLPIEGFRVHGVGLTEKLFDIACAVVDVLARVPAEGVPGGVGSSISGTSGMGEGGEDGDLRYIRDLIARLPGGVAVYNELLDRHIQQTLGPGRFDLSA